MIQMLLMQRCGCFRKRDIGFEFILILGNLKQSTQTRIAGDGQLVI